MVRHARTLRSDSPKRRKDPARFQRLRERTDAGYVIHVDNGAFDATLCGYAYEGSCVESEGDSGVEEVARGKINCADCLRIIWHAKNIPKSALAETNANRLVKVTRNE